MHKQLNIPLSNVKRWIKNHGRIYTPQKKKTRTVAYPDVEQELRSWVIEERHVKKLIIDRADVRRKAKTIAARLGHSRFCASDGWITNFEARNDFSDRAITHSHRKTTKTDAGKVILMHYTGTIEGIPQILLVLG